MRTSMRGAERAQSAISRTVRAVRSNAAAAAVIAAAFALAFVLSTPGESFQPAEASHAGGMDTMSIDLDTTGNTATSLGTVEDCIEVSAGDTVTMDITATNIPASNPMVAFNYIISYNDAPMRLSITGDDHNYLLASNSGGSLFNASAATPDTDSNGTWQGGALDVGAGAPEFGDGVLSRLAVTIDPSAPAAEYPLTFSDAIHVDSNNQPLDPDVLQNATLAVDTPCTGATATDIEVSSVAVSSPVSSAVDSLVTVSASATVHNLGPAEPANVDVSLTLSLPPDCSTGDPLQATTQDVSLDASISTVIPAPDHEWSVTCATASSHQFNVAATAVIDGTTPVDTTPANNTANGQSATVFNAQTDISMTAINLNVPPLTYVATTFPVTASATLHNLGPDGPANVDMSMTITIPPECILMEARLFTLNFDNVSLPVSAATNVPAGDATWFVQCPHGLAKNISVSGTVALDQLHTTDPVAGNQNASAQGVTDTKIGICGDDPDPSGDVLQNLGPLLITLISQLTDDGTQTVPSGLDTPLDCQMSVTATDGPADDCEYNLLTPAPCSLRFDVGLDRPGGTPQGVAGPRLNPIPIFFVAPEFNFAADTAIPNGTENGSANFFIRTDGTLGEFGTQCEADLTFFDIAGYEGGIQGNVPESNDSADITNPDVWPNDLNAERELAESSFDVGLGTGIALRSRMIVPLVIGTIDLPLNVLVWQITDPLFQTATGAGWVVIGFPGDAVGPDPAGTIGGDPDADDPAPLDAKTCAPYREMISFNGSAGGITQLSCTANGSHMSWALLDPDAVNFTQDEGPRSDVSTCSLDLDGDGLTANEETYYGTNPNDADSDDDTVLDGPDNCKLTANPGQADFDGDGLGDVCDPDIDGDGTDNGSDLCPLTTPGVQADANGCSNAQVDDDADGVCDPGAPSGGPAGCTGSDACPDTESGQAVGPGGCSQAQVDADADGACDPGAPGVGPEPCTGVDNCPATPNPGQEDLDLDGLGDACDLDIDGDGVNDIDEANCGSNAQDGGSMPERLEPPGTDEDGDTVVDEGLPAGAENFDCDGDGYSGDRETHIFGDATKNQVRCGIDGWPSDFISGSIPESTNKITIGDLTSFVAPVRRIGTSPGDTDFNVRWDITPGPGPLPFDVNVLDLSAFVTLSTGSPPMFGGNQRALNGPLCSG